MGEARSLQDMIVENAGELFRKQGYAATNIKQIAKASGCTTAALYYYFEDGKKQILGEVIHRSAKEVEFLVHMPQADSLEESLADLSTNLTERFPRVAENINWIMLQFSTLKDEEKRTVQNQVLGIQHALKKGISKYVADEKTAEQLAWLVYCSLLGYQQVFTKLAMAGMVDLSIAAYGEFLAQVIDRGL